MVLFAVMEGSMVGIPLVTGRRKEVGRKKNKVIGSRLTKQGPQKYLLFCSQGLLTSAALRPPDLFPRAKENTSTLSMIQYKLTQTGSLFRFLSFASCSWPQRLVSLHVRVAGAIVAGNTLDKRLFLSC